MNKGSMRSKQHVMNDQRIGWSSILVVEAILLTIYVMTLAPTITWSHHGADGGDLVTAVARGSIPHPPGFPTYLWLGELFIRLPFGDPAWRMNLMSAVLAAGAAGLTAAAVRPLSPFAVCIGLSLGLAPLLWSQAVITEVYTAAAFFSALVLFLALRGGPAWGLGLAWGIGIGAHPTLLFLFPMIVWTAPLHLWKGRSLSQKVQVTVSALVGGGMMYGPVLLARGGAPSPWGDVSTPGGWWALVSGQMYHGYLFGLPLTAWLQRLLAWVGLLARQFTPLGATMTGLGWARMWSERRSLALASSFAFGAFSLYAIGYDTADSLVYLAPALPLAALWLGAGLAPAADWLGSRIRWSGWVVLSLPLLQALLFWGQIDVSQDWTAMEWMGRALQDAPPQAVVLTDQDAHTFTLWYAQDVLGERPDVTVIDVDLWAQGPYREMVEEALGLENVRGDWSPEDAARRTGRPMIRMNDGNNEQ
jgi:hypothetical protein